VIGGAVVEGINWHWIFWLNVPVGVIAVILGATVLRESRGGASRLDALGLVLAAGGMLALVWGVVDGPDHGWSSASVLARLIGGGVLLVSFLAWQRRNRTPMLPLTLFSSRGFSLVNVVTLTFSAGAFGSVFLLAQFFQVVQGLSPLDAGVRTLPWTMAPMVVAPIAGLVAERVGLRTLIVAGQAFLAAGVLWIGLATGTSVAYHDLVVAFVLAGIGMGLTFAPISTMALASVTPSERGVASGANNTIRELGVAVGVAVLASVFSSYGSYTNHQSFVDGLRPAVLTGAAIIAAGAVVALFLPGRTRTAGSGASAELEPATEVVPA
jgi:EmrB/QacA subfamily drug resistance transporter